MFRTNYGMSMIDNLNFIKEKGMENLLRTSKSCGHAKNAKNKYNIFVYSCYIKAKFCCILTDEGYFCVEY